MIELTRSYRFPSAHVLANPSLSVEQNERIFGKCARPAGHGHDYEVQVTLSGPKDRQSGQILPPRLLDDIFDRVVRSRFSHRLLNELPYFEARVPTGENIAREVFGLLAPEIRECSPAALVRVRVIETPRNSFSYEDDGRCRTASPAHDLAAHLRE